MINCLPNTIGMFIVLRNNGVVHMNSVLVLVSLLKRILISSILNVNWRKESFTA